MVLRKWFAADMRGWRNRQTRTFEVRVGNHGGSNPLPRTIGLSRRNAGFSSNSAAFSFFITHHFLSFPFKKPRKNLVILKSFRTFFVQKVPREFSSEAFFDTYDLRIRFNAGGKSNAKFIYKSLVKQSQTACRIILRAVILFV